MSSDVEQRGCFKMKIIEYHDYKTLLGPCFISFSIPLFVPGVVLTVVGSYGNESSFPTFGAWHIIGIIILSFATLMLISGIMLKCLYRPVISADIEKHLSPTHSMITGSKNLGYENDVYCSSNGKLNNRVSHHDLNETHRVVSTHEAKPTNDTKDKHKQMFSSTRRSSQTSSKPEDGQLDENAIASTSGKNPKPVVPPPSYEELGQKTSDSQERKSSTSATRAMQGQVKVTATIVAEAETQVTTGSRDLSSDGGTEQTTFLPEKKRKKKKRRKRHSNLSQKSYTSAEENEGATAENSARQELPELRVKPVLVHDGDEHHHHNLHVHFQDDTANETVVNDNTENKAQAVSETCA